MHDTSHTASNQWIGILALTLRAEGSALMATVSHIISNQELSSASPELTVINYDVSRKANHRQGPNKWVLFHNLPEMDGIDRFAAFGKEGCVQLP